MSDFYSGELRQKLEAAEESARVGKSIGLILEVVGDLVKEIEYLRDRVSELEGDK